MWFVSSILLFKVDCKIGVVRARLPGFQNSLGFLDSGYNNSLVKIRILEQIWLI